MEIKENEMTKADGTSPNVSSKKQKKKKKTDNGLPVKNKKINGESVAKKLKTDPDIDSKEMLGSDLLKNSEVECDAKESPDTSPAKKRKRKRSRSKKRSDKEVTGEETTADSEVSSKEMELEKSPGTDIDKNVKYKRKRNTGRSKRRRRRNADKINGEKNAEEIKEGVKKKNKRSADEIKDEKSAEETNESGKKKRKRRRRRSRNRSADKINGEQSAEESKPVVEKKSSMNEGNDDGESTESSKCVGESTCNVGEDGKAALKVKNKKKKKAVSQVGAQEKGETDPERSDSLKGLKTSESATLEDEGVTGNKAKKNKQKKKSKPEVISPSANGTTTECPEGGSKESSESEANSGAVEVKMNGHLSNEDFKEKITAAWKEEDPYGESGFELIGDPFRACFISDFLEDTSFLNKVKDELSTCNYQPKSNDLYKFSQTSDLKSVKSPYISSLKNFLYGDFRKWLSKLTGIELSEKIDMGSSKYGYTDVLLCHDDELEGRRIAYILYLTPPWYEKDGGTLDLFDNVGSEPRDIVKSFAPAWNSFAFFEVSPVSFHQVGEVLSKNKVRLSINGWFHGADIERPPKLKASPRPLLSAVEFGEEEFYQWVNPSYLDEKTQKQIRKKFQEESEIELEKFLNEDKYDNLCKALKEIETWVNRGPANKQSCKVLEEKQIPEVIQECKRLFQSEAMFVVLSDLTGLKLHPLAQAHSDSESDEEEEKNSECEPGVTIDVRKWSQGSYTLLRDCDLMEKKPSLDAMLFVGVPENWTLEHGGFISYIAKDEDEELLTVKPCSNSLALVYRDLETLKFHKYINSSVQNLGHKKNCFYDIGCTYLE